MTTSPDVVDGIATSVSDEGIARITISRPERMNALDGLASARIQTALSDWATDDAIRVVVIDGAGGAFSTGPTSWVSPRRRCHSPAASPTSRPAGSSAAVPTWPVRCVRSEHR